MTDVMISFVTTERQWPTFHADRFSRFVPLGPIPTLIAYLFESCLIPLLETMMTNPR